MLARSPPATFSIMCSVTPNLELEGKAVNVPDGSHRSNNYITAAYAARIPKDDEEMVLE